MYKYDLHVHTMETRRCGEIRGADMAQRYRDMGYDGICITDHLHEQCIDLMDCHDDWQQCVTRYLYGYREAKKRGDAIGLDVILGVELRFPENDSDYLIYGVDEGWLRRNPYIHRMDHASFFERYKDEVLVIHAHPYRNCDEVFFESVHGLEVANCNPRHKNRNELALALAKAHPRLIRLCGSDAHETGDEGRSAVLFCERITDSFSLKKALLSGDFELYCPEYADIIEAARR